jgi:pilus assembly protein FimV
MHVFATSLGCRSFKEYENKTQMHTKLNSISQANLPTPSKTWRLTVLAAAMGALLSVAHIDANALALGRITSLSSLGEPLVASIDVPDINDEERASLKAALASPDAFRIAGMEYNPALASTQITLVRRDNGSSYLLLRSDKVVTDPFINLVINANWSTGRIVRNYTLLLDPPAAKQTEAAALTAPIAVLPAPAAPQVVAPAQAAAISAPVAAAPARTATPTTVAANPAPAAVPKTPTAPAMAKPSVAAQKTTSNNSGEQVKVGNGDTAGKIAANNLPSNVSLEQMLIAMLRGNPQAFVGNNINRLKAGVILDLPTETEAAAISASEARQSVVAQSKDFNSFRRKLAESAPALTSKSTDRVASGKIEAKVEDQKAAAVTPDKLTLSKGGLTAGDKTAAAAKENLEKIAKERQAKDDAARSAELAKNIKDLNKIASAAPATPAASAATAAGTAPKAAVASATVATPAVAAVVAATPEKPVTPAAPAVAAAVPATPAAPAAPKPPVVAKAPVVVAPVVEPSALDFLMDDPVVLPAAGGLLVALLAGGLYANSKRKKRAAAADAEDDALLDDHFEEKSFFSETSNEPIMEKEAHVVELAKSEEAVVMTVATESIEPAVNARAAVDSLTEANVYLDYGRDVQAEEILKDGLKTQPENAAIYAKLMGIYAKRRDAKNFEQMALKAKSLLAENDPQWLALSKQGFELEPGNPLYHAGAPEIDPFETMSSDEFSTRTVAQVDPLSAKSPASVDLDLDFNFASSFPESIPAKKVEPPKTPLVDFPDFSLEPAQAIAATAASTVAVAAASAAINQASAPVSAPKAMEFDLGHLSLDLNNTESNSSATASTNNSGNNGPLETKLALAHEFRAIGDTTGAKMLANEVLTSATGTLKTKAEALLAEIG